MENNHAWFDASNPPEDGVEVIGQSDKWKHPDFNPDGTRVCFISEGEWVSAKWDNDQDSWHTHAKWCCEENGGKDFNPEKWTYKPVAASQFKSPPVIDEKEMEAMAHDYIKVPVSMSKIKHLVANNERTAFVAGFKKCLSLSSERAMEFSLWKVKNGWNVLGYEGETVTCYTVKNGEHIFKTDSALFDIFCKEKGYSNK